MCERKFLFDDEYGISLWAGNGMNRQNFGADLVESCHTSFGGCNLARDTLSGRKPLFSFLYDQKHAILDEAAMALDCMRINPDPILLIILCSRSNPVRFRSLCSLFYAGRSRHAVVAWRLGPARRLVLCCFTTAVPLGASPLR
jgi:hypothetical protein